MTRAILATILLALAVTFCSLCSATEPRVDLRISVETQPHPVIAGQFVEFSGTISNLGPDTADEVFVRLPGPYPRVFELGNYTTTPALSCQVLTGEVHCYIGSLAVGQVVTNRLQLRPDPECVVQEKAFLSYFDTIEP
jgi:hypothetical protein